MTTTAPVDNGTCPLACHLSRVPMTSSYDWLMRRCVSSANVSPFEKLFLILGDKKPTLISAVRLITPMICQRMFLLICHKNNLWFKLLMSRKFAIFVTGEIGFSLFGSIEPRSILNACGSVTHLSLSTRKQSWPKSSKRLLRRNWPRFSQHVLNKARTVIE